MSRIGRYGLCRVSGCIGWCAGLDLPAVKKVRIYETAGNGTDMNRLGCVVGEAIPNCYCGNQRHIFIWKPNGTIEMPKSARFVPRTLPPLPAERPTSRAQREREAAAYWDSLTP